jgi:hypothetical protein
MVLPDGSIHSGQRLLPFWLSEKILFHRIFVLFFRNIPEFCRVIKDLPSLEDFNRVSSSANGKSRETRTKNQFSHITEGPIMTEELRKVLVALNQDLVKIL